MADRLHTHPATQGETAAQLAAAKIVLTTYDVLRKEVHYDAATAAVGRALRHAKQYTVVPSPLTQVCKECCAPQCWSTASSYGVEK